MKVIIDKAERLWKIPQQALGAMKFSQKRLAARNVDLIDLSSVAPLIPQTVSYQEARQKITSSKINAAADPELIYQLKTKILEKHSSFKSLTINIENEIAIIPNIRMATAFLALALLNRGESAYIPDPGLPHFRTAVCMADANPVKYSLLESNDYILNISSFLSRPKKAKLLFINYPHNPTGAVVDYYFYRDLMKSIRSENILVVADCAYVHPGDSDGASLLQVKSAQKRSLELHSFSTSFGIPGIGFAIGHRDAIAALNAILKAIGFSPDEYSVQMAIAGIENAQEIFADRMGQLERKRSILAEGLRQLGWRIRGGKLTPFIWAKSPTRSTSVALARRLFIKAGIKASPGSDFGEGGEGWLRMSLSPDENILADAIQRISNHSKIFQRKYRPQ